MHIGIACFIVFLIMAALMYSRRISALLALPVMAVAIAVVGGIPAERILKDVISAGAVKLHNAYTTTIFGAILAELINKLGIAKALVRWVAEFAGDNPYLLACVLTLVTALLFSSMGGLGAVIMIGTVVLPVMLSLGISAITAGGLYLFGISLGGMFNLSNWQLYIEVLKIDLPQITAYVVPFAGIIALIILVFLFMELRSLRNLKYLAAGAMILVLGFFGLNLVVKPSDGSADGSVPLLPPSASMEANPLSIQAAGVVLIILALYALSRHWRKEKSLPGASFVAPCLPLLLVLLFHWEIIPAFVAGIVYATAITWHKDSVSLLTRSIIEGTAIVSPAVVLMLGIGMLLNAVMDPAIAKAIAPLLSAIVPTHALPYILAFTALAPLALYRGPLSLWGMGSGIVALIQKSTALGSVAVMSMLMSVGQLQGICDPTNTHNVWIATYLSTDTQALLKRTIPYAWAAVFAGLSLAVLLHYVSW